MGKTTRSTSHLEDSDVDGIINDVLAKQQLTFEKMLEVQQKAFQAFVEANNKRVDELREHAREVGDCA